MALTTSSGLSDILKAARGARSWAATCVVVDRLGDSVEEESGAEAAGEEHAEPAAEGQMSGGRVAGQARSNHLCEVSGCALRDPYRLRVVSGAGR
jgi:hypothetical protein